ncbi:MAG: universal stress protein, partial [Candidatus Latescibacterota bacterium]
MAPQDDQFFVESVFHPSDFSKTSEHAFAHALAIVLHRHTKLTILHAGQESRRERWMNFPSVRGTLERWGLLDGESPRRAVSHELAVKVKKVALKKTQPLSAVLDYLDEHPTDLIVLATEGREGLPRWIRPSMAERLARKTRTMTLFVSGTARGFVSLENGNVTLRRILVPVDYYPKPSTAIAIAARAASLATDQPVEITTLHVGDSEEPPRISLPDTPSCLWSRLQRSGDVIEEIVQTATDQSADLIVMATEGHDGILDALRG